MCNFRAPSNWAISRSCNKASYLASFFETSKPSVKLLSIAPHMVSRCTYSCSLLIEGTIDIEYPYLGFLLKLHFFIRLYPMSKLSDKVG